MSSHDSLAVFAALAAELQQEPDEAITSLAIVTRMRALVPEADQVSLTIRTPRGHKTLASSDALAEEADALQYALDYRVVIERAVGYLMAKQSLDAVAAFNALRNAARSRRTKIGVVSEHVLETGSLPT